MINTKFVAMNGAILAAMTLMMLVWISLVTLCLEIDHTAVAALGATLCTLGWVIVESYLVEFLFKWNAAHLNTSYKE